MHWNKLSLKMVRGELHAGSSHDVYRIYFLRQSERVKIGEG